MVGERGRAIAHITAQWAAVLLGLSIPISAALDGILLVTCVAAVSVGSMQRRTGHALLRHPVAQASVAIFAVLSLGTLYGDRFPGDALRYLSKYLELLAIPFLLLAFREPAARRRALYALAASSLAVLTLSYCMYFGLVQGSARIIGDTGSPVVFKKALTQNFLMAYAAFLFLHLGLAAQGAWLKRAWYAAAALASANVLVMMSGRTGYVVLAALALYSAYAWGRWRALLAMLAGIAALATALSTVPGPFQMRIDRVTKEAREWHEQSVPATESVHFRLQYYATGLAIFAANPTVGVGTGGFPKAYSEHTASTSGTAAANPHSEFLHIGVQVGLVGLALLVWLFYTQWRLSPALPTGLEVHLARGLVIAFVVGCFFNSLLLDHTEGMLFAWLSALLFGGHSHVRQSLGERSA